jgi:hypothetical protein
VRRHHELGLDAGLIGREARRHRQQAAKRDTANPRRSGVELAGKEPRQRFVDAADPPVRDRNPESRRGHARGDREQPDPVRSAEAPVVALEHDAPVTGNEHRDQIRELIAPRKRVGTPKQRGVHAFGGGLGDGPAIRCVDRRPAIRSAADDAGHEYGDDERSAR